MIFIANFITPMIFVYILCTSDNLGVLYIIPCTLPAARRMYGRKGGGQLCLMIVVYCCQLLCRISCGMHTSVEYPRVALCLHEVLLAIMVFYISVTVCCPL